MRDEHRLALGHMRDALALLDEHGPSVCAAFLSQAVDMLAADIAGADAVAGGESQPVATIRPATSAVATKPPRSG